MAVIHRDKWKSQGLGDTIEKITTKTGVKSVCLYRDWETDRKSVV